MSYTKTEWENLPSTDTPLNATNLNKIENQLENSQEQIDNIIEYEDFTSKVTFKENYVSSNTYFIKKGNIVFVTYQGEGKAHSANETLAVIPEGYRPKRTQTFAPFVANSNAYGVLCIYADGNFNVHQISNNTVSSRIYANFSYYLD